MRALLLTILAAVCVASPDPTSAHEPGQDDGVLRLILNDPLDRPRPMDACDVELCTSLLDMITRAEKSIDFAIYGIRNQSAIFEALKAAKARGVKIRGVVDRDGTGKNYYSSTESLVATLKDLRSDIDAELRMANEDAKRSTVHGGVDKCERPKGFKGPLQCLGYSVGDECLVAGHAAREEMNTAGAIMHNKFFVVDGRHLWTGSTNVSDSGTGGYNSNLVVVIDSPKVAAWYTYEFEQMYEKDKYHHEKASQGVLRARMRGDVDIEVLFSPQDRPITTGVRPLLQRAKRRIDIGVFFLTHKGITRDLIKAHRRGVRVRVILDATAAKNGYTKHELLRAARIPVKVENWGGKMHMKSAIIDDDTLITGSMNWTSAGEGGNDENTILITSPTLVRQYSTYFDKLWASIPDKWLKGRPDPESKDSTTACSDGVDNDFDHLADDKDPGCGDNPPPMPELPPWRFVPKQEGYGLVKGNVSKSGFRSYHTPFSKYYYKTKVDEGSGERWFCSEDEARDSGWKRAGM